VWQFHDRRAGTIRDLLQNFLPFYLAGVAIVAVQLSESPSTASNSISKDDFQSVETVKLPFQSNHKEEFLTLKAQLESLLDEIKTLSSQQSQKL
jgi:hypothetical protein